LSLFEVNHAALEVLGEGHFRLAVRNLHAQRLDDFSDIVNGFCVFFSDIFFAFALDNPPGVKGKSVQKRKIILRKKLDAPQPPRV
jgi:hypothetical protein